MPMFREPRHQGCSFCGRAAEQARGIVAGEGVGICDECVALANEVLAERGVRPPARRGSADRSPRERSTGWLTSAQGLEPGEEVVVIDLTAELRLEVDPDDTQDVRWPAVGRRTGS
jgi:ClpX C4-type zinc finger